MSPSSPRRIPTLATALIAEIIHQSLPQLDSYDAFPARYDLLLAYLPREPSPGEPGP